MRQTGLYRRIERLAGSFSGYNIIIGYHIRKQLNFLRGIVPRSFQYREMDDLGCGDGKVTLLLKDIFLPSAIRGFDVNPKLVRRACNRGIKAEVINLDEGMPTGELAVMWGVLHHLKDIEDCLRKIRENYSLIFIREPIKTSVINWLEVGHPLRKESIEYLIRQYLPGSQMFYCGDNILIFYTPPGLNPGIPSPGSRIDTEEANGV